ncbi:MAG: bacterial/archaeal transporter family-2 protein [Baekduia sp.]|nr:bacterial/archaeal transporter family-2 protein [Baekduia sp.]
MDRGVAVVLTVVAGGFIALQSPINSQLGRHVGSLQAAFVSFAIGTVVLLVASAVAKGGLGAMAETRHVSSWIYLTGGVLGAGYVTVALIAVRPLGTGSVIAATIAGELTVAVLIDQLGLFGVDRHPVTLTRIAGILVLAAGVFLIVRE